MSQHIVVASSGLLFCSRKHSISSDFGSRSRIIDNEKRKYWRARLPAPFMCIRWSWLTQVLNSTTTFYPDIDRSFSVLLNSHPHIARSRIRRENSKEKKPYLGRTHARGIPVTRRERREKTYRLPLGYGCHCGMIRWYIRPPTVTGCFRAPVALSLLSSDAASLRKA